MRWYEVTVTGQEAHTGATPMRLRKNALLGAARMIERIDAIAREHAPDAVGTVGLIENKPNSRNVVPGEVFFTVDFRHPDETVLDAMEAKFRAALAEILPPLRLSYTEARIWNSPAVKFAPELIDCVRIGAQKAGFTVARHDLRRRPRRRLHRARRADHHDLRALRRRHFTQRGGIDELRRMRRRRPGVAECGAGIRPPARVIAY